jgi:hypothetical protein
LPAMRGNDGTPELQVRCASRSTRSAAGGCES